MPNRRSPYYVSHDDLVRSTERSLSWMQATYPGMITTGRITDTAARHNIEIEKAKLRLFKRFKKEKRLELFDDPKNINA